MGIRQAKKEELKRLESKTVEAEFLQSIQHGLGCSPFEAEAVLKVVREIYYPFISHETLKAPPGHITLVCVCADEPAGKTISECAKRTVSLQVHRGAKDDRILQKEGIAEFRRSRIPDICQQALSQGVLLTREDLAYHIFLVGTRTISRDLAYLRKNRPEIPIPLRSTVQDIGPVLTHRVHIVRLALEGKTTTQISKIMRHSPEAIANYVETFARCAQLARRKMQVGQIAFLLNRGRGLVRAYLDLLKQCESDSNLHYHLEELVKLGKVAQEKKRLGRGRHGKRT